MHTVKTGTKASDLLPYKVETTTVEGLEARLNQLDEDGYEISWLFPYESSRPSVVTERVRFAIVASNRRLRIDE